MYVDETWMNLTENQPQKQAQERFREYMHSEKGAYYGIE